MLEAQLIEVAKEVPAWFLAGYLVFRMTQQESKTLQAFREGADSQKQLALAIQTLQRLEIELTTLRAELRSERSK